MTNETGRLAALYEEYIRGSEEFHAANRRSVVSLFSGHGRFADCPLDLEHLHHMEDFIAEAAETADETAAAEILEYILLKAHVPDDHPAYWILVAAEGLTGPLLPLLSDDALRPLYERYRKKLRRRGGLPRQRDILKAMKEQLAR